MNNKITICYNPNQSNQPEYIIMLPESFFNGVFGNLTNERIRFNMVQNLVNSTGLNESLNNALNLCYTIAGHKPNHNDICECFPKYN